MDALSELEQRIDEYRKHALNAEKVALRKLSLYPPFNRPLSEVEVLRRELLRHHTRTLLLDELKQWIAELRGMRLYQLYAMPDRAHAAPQLYNVCQYMTEQEATEVNATFAANRERLRWKPIESTEEPKQDESKYNSISD